MRHHIEYWDEYGKHVRKWNDEQLDLMLDDPDFCMFAEHMTIDGQPYDTLKGY